jgi:Na+/melibiose symporter-like transporter
VIVRSFITFYEVPSAALAAEISRDYNERTTIVGYRHFFAWWGGLILMAVSLAFFFRETPEHRNGLLNPEGYGLYSWLAAAAMFLSILVSALGTHHRIKDFHQPPERRQSVLGLFKDMFASFAHRSFLMLMGAGVFGGIAIGVAAAMYTYWSAYFWELTTREMTILLADSFIAAWAALVVTPKVAARIGKRNAKILFLVCAVVIGLAPYLLRLLGWWFANDSPYLIPSLLIHGAIYGVFSIGSLMLTSAMIADVVEDSQLRTGRRSEGLFFSGALLVQKAISGVGIFAAGLILSAVSFPRQARPGDVEPAVLVNLVLLYAAVIATLYAITVWFISQYRLTRATHEENLRRLDAAAPAGSVSAASEPAVSDGKPSPQTT